MSQKSQPIEEKVGGEIDDTQIKRTKNSQKYKKEKNYLFVKKKLNE